MEDMVFTDETLTDILEEISNSEKNIVFNAEYTKILFASVSNQNSKEFANLHLYKKPIQLSEYRANKKEESMDIEFEVNTENMFDMLNNEHMCKFMAHKQLIKSNRLDYNKTDIQLVSEYARINKIPLVRVITKSDKSLYTQYTMQYIVLDTQCIRIKESN